MKKTNILIITLLLLFTLTACDDESSNYVSNLSNTPQETDVDVDEDEMVSEVVYPEDEVIDVNINIVEEVYDDMIQNAMDEEYVSCDITYNGYTLTNVAIRTKGNSSLKDVFEDGGDRYSYNIDLNYYTDQDLYGIDKLILNNLYMDPTMMSEFVAYEALNSLDVVASRTTYVALYINDEYYGLYLSVEHVGNEFLDLNFGNSDGELYKPEMGTGADLDYISDTTNYSALIDKNSEETNNEAIIELMERLSTGENIEEVFDVESYLKYLAVSTYTVNLDSYQGGMYHNYYLYNNDGVFEWITWDLNMAFNGFPMVNLTDEQAINYLIDEPTIGAISNYALISAILSNDEYLELYHTYLQELCDNYFDTNTFITRVEEIYNLIDDYVKTDPNSFYSYSTFLDAVYTESNTSYSILQFVELRTENVEAQLSGTIPSTNNGEGNEGSGMGMPGDKPTRPH